MSSLSPEYRYAHLPDELLEATFSPEQISRDHRVDRIRQLGEDACSLLLEPWEDDPSYTVRGIRLAAMYGCLPSLETVIQAAPHTIETAQQVSDNMQDICEHLSSTRLMGALSVRKDKNHLIGQMSEMAALGTLWWGIANGCRDEGDYVLPSDTQQDNGREKDGLHLAADLVLRHGGSRSKDLIQIKSDLSRITKRKMRRYHPELAVITPGQLIGDRANGTRFLIDSLARNHNGVLVAANQRAEELLQAARERGAEYRRSQASKRTRGKKGVLYEMA